MLRQDSRGQILIVVLGVLLGILIIIPFLVRMIQSESKWTEKIKESTTAFHLAESAVEIGYSSILTSSSAWTNILAGTVPAGYRFDSTYSELEGDYQINISSVSSNSIAIIGVGRDRSSREVRGLRVVYSSSGGTLSVATYANDQLSIQSSGNVEWGPLMSRIKIDTNSKLHPRFYSVATISPNDTNGSALPNTDSIQWWSYYAAMPPSPAIDLNYYLNLATTLGATGIAGCGALFYNVANLNVQGCNLAGAVKNGTWFVLGNFTFRAGGGGNCMSGTLVTLGNIQTNGNGGASCSQTLNLPSTAWKEYGNDWAYYKTTWDPAAPASYASAVAANYTSPSTPFSIGNMLFRGFIYAGADIQLTGSGNLTIGGVIFSLKQPQYGANMTLYYDASTSVQLQTASTLTFSRSSWNNVTCSWPSGSNASCP